MLEREIERLKAYFSDFQEDLAKAETIDELNRVKGRYLGRKSPMGDFLNQLRQLPPEEKRIWGQQINAIKNRMEESFKEKYEQLVFAKGRGPFLDVTLPGKKQWVGSFHPVLVVRDQILSIFQSLGFRIESGPEIESDFYNFEALNIPPDHPARDDQDSFYLSPNWLLRTHTSPGQIRAMKKLTPPFKVVVPGRCYRRDAFDATHSPMFHQIEGLVVAPSISMGDLKGTVEIFVRRFFGPHRKVRFRPSYFPFTEPSAEVDVSCGVCQGKGCRSCGYTGWLEIMGSGLVHPQVFERVGYDSEKVRGFAFGMGVERITMLKFGITDIRWFLENDVHFLEQFKALR
ncbi:MAG: phenylalanine--tRNA ligase subunit alpha [Candidatus Caldatribacteriaceae bacterium]